MTVDMIVAIAAGVTFIAMAARIAVMAWQVGRLETFARDVCKGLTELIEQIEVLDDKVTLLEAEDSKRQSTLRREVGVTDMRADGAKDGRK